MQSWFDQRSPSVIQPHSTTAIFFCRSRGDCQGPTLHVARPPASPCRIRLRLTCPNPNTGASSEPGQRGLAQVAISPPTGPGPGPRRLAPDLTDTSGEGARSPYIPPKERALSLLVRPLMHSPWQQLQGPDRATRSWSVSVGAARGGTMKGTIGGVSNVSLPSHQGTRPRWKRARHRHSARRARPSPVPTEQRPPAEAMTNSTATHPSRPAQEVKAANDNES